MTAPCCRYSPLFNFLILFSYSENVTETIHTAGVHVFQANSQNVQTCQVDVGFTPKPDEQGTSRMCFKAGLVIIPPLVERGLYCNHLARPFTLS